MLNTKIMVKKFSNSNFIHKSSGIFNIHSKFFGAYFLQNGYVLFKLLTFDDVTKVTLEVKPKGEPIKSFDMNKTEPGIWQLEIENGIVKNGDRYRYIIERKGESISVKDPCSMYQDSYFKWSVLYNHSIYKWNDSVWMNGRNFRRVSRLADEVNMLSPVEALRIYELHIGTFTPEGTYKSAKEKLKYISETLNFNAIEIMPVENTYSFNWGYDGVDKYAPNHTYGTPDELKELIDYAHKCNLNVIMDIVPNHLGPDIAELQKTGPYIEGENCFGYKFNFEKDSQSSYVRDFIIGAALNWLINYHCDGLRVDMTKFMCSDFTMKQMVAEVNYYCPLSFLIAEDGRDNDSRVTKPFTQNEIEYNELHHESFINSIKNNDVSLSNLGFDSEWDFPFHKQIASMLLGSWDCRIKNISNFDFSLRDAQSRVKYVMSHDEIGNIDGTRLISKILVNELNLTSKVCNCDTNKKCQVSAHAAHKLLDALVNGSLEKMSDSERLKFYESINLHCNFSVSDIYEAYIKAVKMHKLALGKIYSVPGPKMVFQGDESANLSYFKFFRKFSIGPEPYLRDKGYEPGIDAFKDSKLNCVCVCDKYCFINKGVENYITALNKLCDNNISLTNGHIEKTLFHENSDIHAIYTRKIYNEIVSISNFSGVSYLNNYGMLFPKGRWKEILNSDDTLFSGEGKYMNPEPTKGQFNYISLPAYGIVFFEKII